MKVTTPVKPFWGVTVIVSLPLVPGFTVTLEVAAARLNAGVVTTKLTGTALVREPDVPPTVNTNEPAEADLDAARVSVLLPPLTALKVAETPAGKPEAAKATTPAKPF